MDRDTSMCIYDMFPYYLHHDYLLLTLTVMPQSITLAEYLELMQDQWDMQSRNVDPLGAFD